MKPRHYFTPGQLSFLEDPTAARFRTFHHDNPHVYRRLVELAREYKATGRTRCSVELLFGKLRWEIALATEGDAFRLNDHFTAHYARLIMANEPDLDGLFATRQSKADAA